MKALMRIGNLSPQSFPARSLLGRLWALGFMPQDLQDLWWKTGPCPPHTDVFCVGIGDLWRKSRD